MPSCGRQHPKISEKMTVPDLEEEEGGRGLVLVAALSECWDWYLTQELPAKSSGANLPHNGPNTPMSADLLRMHYYRGGHRTRGRHDRLGL